METIIDVIKYVGYVLLLGILTIYEILVYGFICFKFWHWFVIPVFPTLPNINYWQGVSLMMFIFLFHNVTKTISPAPSSYSERVEQIVDELVSTILKPWMMWFIGWMMTYLFIH